VSQPPKKASAESARAVIVKRLLLQFIMELLQVRGEG